MHKQEFINMVNACVALIERCTAPEACPVDFRCVSEGVLGAMFHTDQEPLVYIHGDQCFGHFHSPVLDPDGRPFAPIPHLPLKDAPALRGFLLLHLCPDLAHLDLFKHMGGGKHAFQCQLGEDGAYYFHSALLGKKVALRVNGTMPDHIRPPPARTGAGFNGEYSALPPSHMVEHASFMPPSDPNTQIQMSKATRERQKELLTLLHVL